jgi:hypothetical protein
MDIDMSLKQLEKSLGKFTYFQGKFLLKQSTILLPRLPFKMIGGSMVAPS